MGNAGLHGVGVCSSFFFINMNSFSFKGQFRTERLWNSFSARVVGYREQGWGPLPPRPKDTLGAPHRQCAQEDVVSPAPNRSWTRRGRFRSAPVGLTHIPVVGRSGHVPVLDPGGQGPQSPAGSEGGVCTHGWDFA